MAWRQYSSAILLLSLGVSVVRADGVPSAWESLHLSTTVIGGATVHYESALEPNLPVFERELKALLGQRAGVVDVLEKKEQVVAEINRILGAEDTDADEQAGILVRLSGAFAGTKLTFYLVRQETIKDFLRAGGRLPHFSYDPQSDKVSYEPQFHWDVEQEPPEHFEFCLPVASDQDFGTGVSGMLGVLMNATGEGMVSMAIHEVTEMAMLRRARPTDPYWRWFSDGFANAITRHLIEKYISHEAAEEFAAAYDLGAYRDLEEEVNLAYWMMGNFCAYVSRAPVEQEVHILHARYAYAMFEAQRLIDEHGLDCIRAFLDKITARESRTGTDLLAVVKEVTGEDMAARLARYQTFATREEGIPKYGRAYEAAMAQRNWAAMFVNVMRIMELRGDVFSLNYLQSFGNAALFLFKMGREEAGDAVMRRAMELYAKSPAEQGREAAMAMFVAYALQCRNPEKAERQADELLAMHPEDAPSLAVKMMTSLNRGDLPKARELARRVRERSPESSNPYKLASNVLAIDPNRPNRYNQQP